MSKWGKFYSLTSENHSDNTLEMEKPHIVGLMEDGKTIKKSNRMKYLRLPEPSDYPLDLNKGFENYNFRPENKLSSNMDIIASYLMSVNPRPNKTKDDFEVVTHRGLLSSLMQTGHYKLLKKNLKVLAIKYKNKLFLMKGFENFGKSITSSHQFKLRQYIFSDDPDSKPDCNAPIDEKEQLYCIYQTKLGNLNIVYSGEISGIISVKKKDILNNLNQCRFVQSKVIADTKNFWLKNKMIIDFYMKAYLAGIEDLYLGSKNADGFVTQPIQHLTVTKLIEEQKCSPKVGVKFMHGFINKIIKKMEGIDSPHICYEFNLNHQSACVDCRVHLNEAGFSFLPEDFVNYLDQ